MRTKVIPAKKKVKKKDQIREWVNRVNERFVEIQGIVAKMDRDARERIEDVKREIGERVAARDSRVETIDTRLRDTQYKLDKLIEGEGKPRPTAVCPLCNAEVCVNTELNGIVMAITPNLSDDIRRKGDRRYNQHKVNVSRVIEGKRYFGLVDCPMSGHLVQEWGSKAVKES